MLCYERVASDSITRWLRRVQCWLGKAETAEDYLVGTVGGLPPLWTPRGLTCAPGTGDLLVSDTGRHVIWHLELPLGARRRRWQVMTHLLPAPPTASRRKGGF